MIREKQIILNRGDYTTCAINTIGGTVTSWKIQHIEQLFVSRETEYTGLNKIKGGCNIAFPHFGLWEMGPPYGFTRDMPWSLEEGPQTLTNGDVWALISCRSDPYTNSMYSYQFKITYKITLCEYKLIFNIYVENLSKYLPMEYRLQHQVAFKVPDVTKCEIVGLHKCPFLDYQESDDIGLESREIATVSGETDRLYIDVPGEITVSNMMAGGKMKTTRKGENEYTTFLAVEAGNAMVPMRLEPLSCWQARHALEIIPKEKRKEKIVSDFYDLFNDYC